MFDDSPEVILSCPVGKHYVKIETKYNRFTKVEHSAPSFLEAVKYFIQIYKK